jgi:hypothetical protein
MGRIQNRSSMATIALSAAPWSLTIDHRVMMAFMERFLGLEGNLSQGRFWRRAVFPVPKGAKVIRYRLLTRSLSIPVPDESQVAGYLASGHGKGHSGPVDVSFSMYARGAANGTASTKKSHTWAPVRQSPETFSGFHSPSHTSELGKYTEGQESQYDLDNKWKGVCMTPVDPHILCPGSSVSVY